MGVFAFAHTLCLKFLPASRDRPVHLIFDGFRRLGRTVRVECLFLGEEMKFVRGPAVVSFGAASLMLVIGCGSPANTLFSASGGASNLAGDGADPTAAGASADNGGSGPSGHAAGSAGTGAAGKLNAGGAGTAAGGSSGSAEGGTPANGAGGASMGSFGGASAGTGSGASAGTGSGASAGTGSAGGASAGTSSTGGASAGTGSNAGGASAGTGSNAGGASAGTGSNAGGASAGTSNTGGAGTSNTGGASAGTATAGGASAGAASGGTGGASGGSAGASCPLSAPPNSAACMVSTPDSCFYSGVACSCLPANGGNLNFRRWSCYGTPNKCPDQKPGVGLSCKQNLDAECPYPDADFCACVSRGNNEPTWQCQPAQPMCSFGRPNVGAPCALVKSCSYGADACFCNGNNWGCEGG
jgi:hypothetical protein